MLKSNMHFSRVKQLSLTEFAAYEESYALKLEQIMTARKIEDTERIFCREDEDEKYNIILNNRRREDQLIRAKRKTEDNEVWDAEKMIEDEELVSGQKPYSA
jgi:hypothetical protein